MKLKEVVLFKDGKQLNITGDDLSRNDYEKYLDDYDLVGKVYNYKEYEIVLGKEEEYWFYNINTDEEQLKTSAPCHEKWTEALHFAKKYIHEELLLEPKILINGKFYGYEDFVNKVADEVDKKNKEKSNKEIMIENIQEFVDSLQNDSVEILGVNMSADTFSCPDDNGYLKTAHNGIQTIIIDIYDRDKDCREELIEKIYSEE